jgi:two-component system response regulator (stage 0 sporulation protein A)
MRFFRNENIGRTLDPEEVSLRAELMVRELGIPVELNGYLFLVIAVSLSVRKGDECHALVKAVYEEVSRQFNCTGANVERCIRNAIFIAWKNDREKMMRFFAEDSSMPVHRCPTNRQLISAMTWKIRRDMLSTLVAENNKLR